MRTSNRPNDETWTHRSEGADPALQPTETSGPGPKIPSTAFVGNFGLPAKFGSYEILEDIGYGGMGVVYKARELPLGRIVALKHLFGAAAAHPAHRDRFLTEAKAAAALEHPNIVPIYHFGVEQGQPYFTMKYLPCGTLSEHRDRFRGKARDVVALMIKVARAVQHAHKNKVLHRDLKPSNVFLDENDEPMVGDFGVAKLLDGGEPMTQTGAILGTLPYMAPEQKAGRIRDLSFATDVYSLGVTIFELIVGKRPFADGADSTATGGRKATATPATEPVSLDPTLDSIICKCLREKPADRYPTAAALADDLEKWLAGIPVTIVAANDADMAVANVFSRSVRTWRRLPRRRRIALSAIALILLTAVVAVAALLYQRHQNENALAKLRGDLVDNGEVSFLTPDGSLRWCDTVDTDIEYSTRKTAEGPELAVSCKGHGLLELIRGLPDDVDEVIFQAQVRSNGVASNLQPYVGIYAGRSRKNEASNGYHCFVCVQFCDLRQTAVPKDFLNVEFSMIYLGNPIIRPTEINPPQADSNPSGWRDISLRVTPDGIYPSFSDLTLIGANRSRLRELVGKKGYAQPLEISRLTPEFQCSEGFGLFVSGCNATFRDIRMTSQKYID